MSIGTIDPNPQPVQTYASWPDPPEGYWPFMLECRYGWDLIQSMGGEYDTLQFDMLVPGWGAANEQPFTYEIMQSLFDELRLYVLNLAIGYELVAYAIWYQEAVAYSVPTQVCPLPDVCLTLPDWLGGKVASLYRYRIWTLWQPYDPSTPPESGAAALVAPMPYSRPSLSARGAGPTSPLLSILGAIVKFIGQGLVWAGVAAFVSFLLGKLNISTTTPPPQGSGQPAPGTYTPKPTPGTTPQPCYPGQQCWTQTPNPTGKPPGPGSPTQQQGDNTTTVLIVAGGVLAMAAIASLAVIGGSKGRKSYEPPKG